MFDGQYLTAPELETQLSYIENWVQNQSQDGPGVGALTTAPRTDWALNRQYLKRLSPDNEKYLDIIEKSLSVCAFEDKEPQNQCEVKHIYYYYIIFEFKQSLQKLWLIFIALKHFLDILFLIIENNFQNFWSSNAWIAKGGIAKGYCQGV